MTEQQQAADGPQGMVDAASRSARVGCFVRAFLLFHLLSLVALVAWRLSSDAPWIYSAWHSDHPNPLVRWSSRAFLVGLRDSLLFIPLGFLVAGLFATIGSRRGWIRLLSTLAIAAAISVSVALLARTGLNGLPLRRPSILSSAFLAFVTTVGCWAGATWFYSRGFFRWVLGQVLLLFVCAGGTLAVFIGFGLETTPAPFSSEPVGTADRRRLVQLFETHDPREIAPESTVQLTLSERDLNQLLSWGLALGPEGQKARVALSPRKVRFDCSSRLPFVGRYLNVVATGTAYVNDGELAVKPQSLRIGRIAIPRLLLVACGPSIVDRAFQNRHTRPFLASLKDVQLKQGETTVTYGFLKLSEDLVSRALLALGGRDMEPATTALVQHLTDAAKARPSLDFGNCLQLAFQEAAVRTKRSQDPVVENRAAILALGYLLGSRRIKAFVGSELPDPPPPARATFNRVTLRGRKDWRRHFTVSAALEVLSNPATSNMLGLLKEELDANGGSGFSFSDLLADNTGTAFGRRATRSPEAALQFQRRLAGSFELVDYFPNAEDLPEGLSDDEFQRRFGGVGGAGYTELMNEIQRRIDGCQAYAD